MSYPNLHQLIDIAIQTKGNTPEEKAEAALKLWCACDALLKQKEMEEEKEYEPPEERMWPREFFKRFHPRDDKSLKSKCSDYTNFLYDGVKNSYTDHESGNVEATHHQICRETQKIIDEQQNNGIPISNGEKFVAWYKSKIKESKAINGRKGGKAKKFKNAQKTEN